MTGDVDIIHHPGLVAEDIEAAVAQYERLGFMFTPLSLVKITIKAGEEPVYLGAGNRNAIFERNFLEIVGITDKAVWASFPKEKRGPFDLDRRMGLYRGLHIMHFGADDLEVVRARFTATGIPASDIARLQRTVDTPEGPRVMEAKTIFFRPDANPEGLIQMVQHVTPQYALQPRYVQHRNGARRLTEVIVCDAAPDALAAKYSRYAGHRAVHTDGLHVIDLGYSRILIVDPAGLARLVPGYTPPHVPCIAGFTVACNLAATGQVLAANGIAFAERDGRLIVSPQDGCGSAVLFEAPDASR